MHGRGVDHWERDRGRNVGPVGRVGGVERVRHIQNEIFRFVIRSERKDLKGFRVLRIGLQFLRENVKNYREELVRKSLG